MPGLAAIISPSSRDENESDIHRMVQSMCHEPFYSTGTFIEPSLGLYIGWVSHDNSGDGLPLRSADGTKLVFLYGEHMGDNSVLELFEAHGIDAVRRMNGWFHGIAVDFTRAEVAVFNDRFGMQRLHTVTEGEASLFSSEAKALLAIRPRLRKLDDRALGEYLTTGGVLEQRSLFSGVKTLAAASIQSFRNCRKVDDHRYFQPGEWESQQPLEAAEHYLAVRGALETAIGRCSKSRLPIAVSLTGGFDTRLIMAYLKPESGLPCYTFGGMYRDCFDVQIARKVAKICNLRHQVLEVGQSFLADFPKLAATTVRLSDGCLGATNAYELYLNRLARNVGVVRLTGSFGSEVMRGARAFKAIPPTEGLIHEDFKPQIRAAVQTFNEVSRGHDLSFSVFKQAPWQYFNRLAVEQSQVVVRTPFMDNDLIGVMYQSPVNRPDGRRLARQMIADRNPALASLRTDTGNCSYLRQQFSEILFKADYCYKSGMPQWLERIHYILGPMQPEKLLIGRHRFAHFRVWFRRELAGYVKAVLLDPRTLNRPYFNRDFVQEIVARHLKGDQNHTTDIERVLTLELTCREFIDN